MSLRGSHRVMSIGVGVKTVAWTSVLQRVKFLYIADGYKSGELGLGGSCTCIRRGKHMLVYNHGTLMLIERGI